MRCLKNLRGPLSGWFHRQCTFLLAVIPAALLAAEPLAITEFAASNTTGLQDENGDRPDWVEIFNSSTNVVNLDGWFLTDSPGNLTRWRFPATNLAPQSFLVVFASGKDRAVPGQPLHANFALSAGGEYLALVHSNGFTIASEFSPQFPPQFANISYGLGQSLQVTRFVSNTTPARVFVATNSAPAAGWNTVAFDDTAWRPGTNGVGFETYVSGFAVKNIRANVSVCDLSTALGVLANPAQQAAVFTANPGVMNYLSTGDDAHFGSGATFPGFSIGVDENNFVTEATGILTIPVSGNYTFGVNSDDGFTATIGGNVFEYPSPRGPSDTLATFFLAAGEHSIRVVFYECGGGAGVEFFAAAGVYSGFDAAFRLVGDTAGGGLAVKSLPNAGGSTTSLRPLIATDVQVPMALQASSAFVRLPFTVMSPGDFSTLTLRMKYDDGFVAYLNGTEVARRNAPAVPQWNSAATASRPTSSALTFEDIDLTPHLGLLQSGANVLAIQGLNDSVSGTDFLVLAELVENKALGTTNLYFATPTPGTFNSSEFAAFVDNLKFTPGRGWFENTNFYVTLTTITPGASIRYTTNGSAPTSTSGTLYTGPILINGTTLLRAIGYAAGFASTKVETHTYLFLDQVQAQSTNVNYVGGSSGDYTLNTNVTQSTGYRDSFKNDLLGIPTLAITMDWEDLFGATGINSNPQGEGVGWERPCSLEYMRPDGQKGFDLNCGIRLQGGVSRSAMPKHGLRVLFKTIYGPGKLEYDLYPDSPVKEFDTLTLHASFNDHWLWGGTPATMHRDQWCRDTQNAMGGYGPHGTYAHVYLNGIYWGLYNIGEKGDASYAAHYLGGEKEEYDAINSDELIDGTTDAWNTMHIIANLGITNDLAYTNLAQYLNIPNFIDYMLLNFYAANTDWPGHNWNAARRRVPGAGYHFFSWDAEWTFGIGSDVNTDRTGIGLNDGSPGRLYAALRTHPEFVRQFGDHAQKHLFNGGVLTPAASEARYAKWSAPIDRAIVGEAARWGQNTYFRETWVAADAGVKAWFPQRTAIVLNQLRNAGLYPQVGAPGFSQWGGLVPPGYSLAITNPNGAGSIYFTLDGSDPRLWGGGLAASAQLYSSPLTITNALFVQARVRSGTNWSALVEAPFYVVQDFSGLALTEIMYHPPNFGTTNGDEVEFLELKNTGTNSLDLSGLQFTDGITFAFTNGTRLAAGQFLVLARNAAAFAAKYPGVTAGGIYTGKLDNAGERLTLAHILGTNVFSFTYGTLPPWPITPDSYGFSLVRAATAADPDASTSWRASASLGGSPGADDPPASIPAVVINEILTHTDPPQWDAIELLNPTTNSVHVGGWFLSDDAADPKKFRLTNGTILAPGGFLVLTESDFNPQPGVPPSFALNSWGESLYLFSGDVNTNLTGYSHSFDYGAAANGVSFGRHVISTGEEQWPAQSTTTLGATNAAPRVGPVVINEVLYHPASGYDEFVELFNLSSTNVPLYDPAHPANAWKLSGLGYTFSNNVTLPAGAYLLLVPMDPAAFRAKYAIAPQVQIVGPYAGVLQDSGERLRLERPDNPDTNGVPYIVVDEVRYNDRPPWPSGADGDGPSLQRRAPLVYGNEPTNWFASGITPGATNSFNQPPVCTLLAPTNGAVFTAPVHLELSAMASDPDGFIVRVEYFNGDLKLGESTNAPFTFVWSNAPVGTHNLVAKARDNGLAVTPSAPAAVTITPPPIGTGIGLRADYYDNADFTGTRVRRIDPTVNFDWGTGQPDAGIGADSFSVRWLGQVQPRFSETYTFHTISDDGVRLWVNNQLLVDNWTDHGNTENVGFIPLQAGQLYDIKMEMYENGGGAVAQLLWSSISVAREIIPSTQLYPPLVSNVPPVISITSPATGAVFVASSTVNCAVTTSDPDGFVFKVAYYDGALKLGETTGSPFNFAWTNIPAGSHLLTAVATDDGGASQTSAPVSLLVVAGFTSNITLIATGSVWKYRDTGENLGTAWSLLEFNDSGWSNGPAQLGYGDGDERTVVGYGPNSGSKYITTYFRRSFQISDPASFSALNLRVLRDDGVVVYLNGSEVFRDNMPGGAINYLTAALVAVGGTDETTYYPGTANPGYLVFGTNVLAVELHQSGGGSSDLGIDLELKGTQNFVAPYITAQPQSQSAVTGTNVAFSVTAGGTGPLRYQWRRNGTNLLGSTNSALVLVNLQTNHAASYSVVVSNVAGVATSAVAVLTVTVADSDGDGMPDEWEAAHGLNPYSNDANLDLDHDGLSNLMEFRADTDPGSSQSVLKAELIRSGTNAWAIRFDAVSNLAYGIQVKPHVGSGIWSNLLDLPSAPTNRSISLPISTNLPESYFRILTPGR